MRQLHNLKCFRCCLLSQPARWPIRPATYSRPEAAVPSSTDLSALPASSCLDVSPHAQVVPRSPDSLCTVIPSPLRWRLRMRRSELPLVANGLLKPGLWRISEAGRLQTESSLPTVRTLVGLPRGCILNPSLAPSPIRARHTDYAVRWSRAGRHMRYLPQIRPVPFTGGSMSLRRSGSGTCVSCRTRIIHHI